MQGLVLHIHILVLYICICSLYLYHGCFLGWVYLCFVNVRAVLVFGSAEVGDTGNYSCVADQAAPATVLLIVTPGHFQLIIIFIVVTIIIFIIEKLKKLRPISGPPPPTFWPLGSAKCPIKEKKQMENLVSFKLFKQISQRK